MTNAVVLNVSFLAHKDDVIAYNSVGAGHPGEDDIGGLVLVCRHIHITS